MRFKFEAEFEVPDTDAIAAVSHVELAGVLGALKSMIGTDTIRFHNYCLEDISEPSASRLTPK